MIINWIIVVVYYVLVLLLLEARIRGNFLGYSKIEDYPFSGIGKVEICLL